MGGGGAIYRIRGWDEFYECAATRKLKTTNWVPVSNNLSNAGMLALRDGHPNGWVHLALWLQLLELASRCSPRGHLVWAGKPHTVETLALCFRCEPDRVAEGLARLVEIGWVEGDVSAQNPPTSADTLADSPNTLADSADMSADRGGKVAAKGREGKGREQKEKHTPVEPASAAVDVDAIYATWKAHHRSGLRVAPPKIRRLIQARLKDGFSALELQDAIEGNHVDPHCCGRNERNGVYHDLPLILRDAAYVTRYREALARYGTGERADQVREELQIPRITIAARKDPWNDQPSEEELADIRRRWGPDRDAKRA